MIRKLIIAIDGPVGSGKTTVARRVAALLGYIYLDSGAMYRALAWKAIRDGVPLDLPAQLETLARETRIDLVYKENAMHVLVDGEFVVRDGASTRFDGGAVTARAREEGKKVRARARI